MTDDPYAFLSPSLAAPEGDRTPVLRTPMERHHLAAGARIEEREGWRIAEYPGNGGDPWAADVSHTGKLDVRAAPERLDELLGEALAIGRARREDGTWTLRLSPTRAVVLCPFGRVDELRARFGDAAVDMTCGWAAVALGGERAREVLNRSSALDVRPKSFPPGACTAGSVLRTSTILLHEDDGRFRLLAGWELGEYLWESLLDAGAPLGIERVSAAVALPEEVPA
jgi:heterotetrameric sarcosine oxidase gamma subunit